MSLGLLLIPCLQKGQDLYIEEYCAVGVDLSLSSDRRRRWRASRCVRDYIARGFGLCSALCLSRKTRAISLIVEPLDLEMGLLAVKDV